MSTNVLDELDIILAERKKASADSSYVASLYHKGLNKILEKVGEEAVELVIEAKDDNKELFLNEAADLMYHFLVLLTAKGVKLEEIVNVLKSRHAKSSKKDRLR